MFVDKYNFSTLTGVTEVFHVCRLVYNPSTFTTVTEFFHVDVLKLYLSTDMQDLSDTSRCTEVILIYKHGRPQ
jgi:hypothetical protein